MIVSVSGCDGSGKSTLIDTIVDLSEHKKLELQVIREFDYAFLNPIARSMKKQNAVRVNFMAGDRRIRPLTLVWAHMVYVDLLIRALYHKLTRRDVIYDRFFLDYGIGFYNLTGHSYFINLFKVSPKPDLAVYCFADADTLYKRRLQQGRDKGFYTKQLKTYRLYGQFDLAVDTGKNSKHIKLIARKITDNYEKR